MLIIIDGYLLIEKQFLEDIKNLQLLVITLPQAKQLPNKKIKQIIHISLKVERMSCIYRVVISIKNRNSFEDNPKILVINNWVFE